MQVISRKDYSERKTQLSVESSEAIRQTLSLSNTGMGVAEKIWSDLRGDTEPRNQSGGLQKRFNSMNRPKVAKFLVG